MAPAPGKTATILVASDTHGALTGAYHPSGLTVVLVNQVGSVRSVQRNLGPTVQLGDSLRMLGHSRAAEPRRPRRAGPGRESASGPRRLTGSGKPARATAGPAVPAVPDADTLSGVPGT